MSETDLQGLEIPKDPQRAKTHVMGVTQNFQRPTWWSVKRFYLGRLPTGVRAYPERALLQPTPAEVAEGVVTMLYRDGEKIHVDMLWMHIGVMSYGDQVTQKYLPAKKGDRDMLGVTHAE